MTNPMMLWHGVQGTFLCVCDSLASIDVDDCTFPCYVTCPKCGRQWRIGTHPTPITLWLTEKKP